MKLTRYLLSSLLALAVAACAFVWLNREALHIAAGSVSQSLCAAAFVSQVDPDRVFMEEQRPLMGGIAWAVRYTVDRSRREVRSSALVLFRARSVYRE